MRDLTKALDGYKTYMGCLLSVAIAVYAYHYYPSEFPLKDLIGTILLALAFINSRMGNKSDTAKVIAATSAQTVTLTEQVDKAIAIPPCDSPVTNNSLDKAVDAIVNRQNSKGD